MTSPTTPSRNWVRTKTDWVKIKGICPACNHNGWCTRSVDGTVIKCMRAESSRPCKQQDGTTAWLHYASAVGGVLAPAKPEKATPKLKQSEITAMLKQFDTSLSPKRLSTLSNQLGVSEKALKAFGVGYAIEYGCYSFPMFDGQRKPIGIHLRRAVPIPNGKNKFSVKGSENGLFIPADYESFEIPPVFNTDPYPLLLLVPEGVSDAMAARDMGFRSIGRPSNIGGAHFIRRLLLSGGHKQDVVVIADQDEPKKLPNGTFFFPGIQGALQLCEQLIDVCGRLQFMYPPPGVKDLREMLNAGRQGETKTSLVDRKWLEAAKRVCAKRCQEGPRPAA